MSLIKEIDIDEIIVGEHNQRLEIDSLSLDGLCASIGRIGLVYPLVVRADGDRLVLLEGHRRLAACRRLGLKTVRCDVRDVGQDRGAEIAFAGNFFRKDLSPVELAGAMKDCLATGTMNIEQIAAGFHRSIHWVHSMIAISDWPSDVQEAIHDEKLSVSAGSNLALVTDDNYRTFLVRNAVEQGATARTTASWLQAWRAMQPQEVAITSEPVDRDHSVVPMVPQAPCLCCGRIYPVNEMSHVPVCGGCVQIIRRAGTGG